MSDYTATPMWTIGLSDQAQDAIRQCSDAAGQLMPREVHCLTDWELYEKEKPQILWISLAAWKQYISTDSSQNLLGSLPSVLMLDESCTPDDCAAVLPHSFFDIVRSHTERAKINSIMSRVLEAQNVTEAISRMSREIHLDREILDRKINVIDFLQLFITETAACTNKKTLFEVSKTCISRLLPLRGLHLGVWRQQGSQARVQIYLDCAQRSAMCQSWGNLLRDIVHLSGPVNSSIELVSWSQACPDIAPDPQTMLIMPLRVHDHSLGVVVLDLVSWQRLGKDQSQALDAAMLHLGALLQNFVLQSQEPFQASYDATDTFYQKPVEQQRLAPLSRHSL